MKFAEVPLSSLKPAPWRATYCLKPDLRLLRESLIESGWVAPIVVRHSDMMIVDGHYRWWLAQENKKVAKVLGPNVPVVLVDCDDVEAMLIHVRLNLGRGRILGEKLSKIMKLILMSGKYTEDQIQSQLCMTDDEFDVIVDGTLLKKRKIPEHQYSPAWVPVEVPEGQTVPTMKIESPPNADR